MRVSIILPVFNAEKWISETIKSIVAQTFVDWELICIDDLSSDGSIEIIQSWMQRESRIQLLTNTEKGIIPCLQLGIREATGEFITRMDSDDIMPPNRLFQMHESLSSSKPKTILTGHVHYFSESTVSQGYVRYEEWLNERAVNNDHFDHIYRECVVASPNWMARTAELRADRIFESLRYPEDYDMVFHWKANGYRIKAIQEVTLHWREHPERTSRNSDVYDQASFFALKLEWFLKLHVITTPIGLLGAGGKGKITADFLIGKHVPFHWYDFKAENYTAPILGHTIRSYSELNEHTLLIAIYPKDLNGLHQFLEEKGYEIGRNAWFL